MASPNKILAVIGPTATGKTKMAVRLAKAFNGELISADSRQVYQYMDIGTGKDLPKNSKFEIKNLIVDSNEKIRFGTFDFEGVPIWGLDIVEPDYWFNVSDWVEYVREVIEDILSRGKLPIIVGGTGQYVQSLINPPDTLGISVNKELRDELSSFSVVQLQDKLKEINPERWEQMNNSDRNNPRRLIRAIEVGKQKQEKPTQKVKYNLLFVGLESDKEIQNQKIDQRVGERVNAGIQEEIRQLLTKGYSWNLPSMSGLGYREFRNYKSSESLQPIINRWVLDEQQYAQRQLTYMKKYFPQTIWFKANSSDLEENVDRQVKNWLDTAS